MAVTDSFVSFGAEMTMPCPRCGAAASSSVSEMIHMDQLRWGYELHCSHCQTRLDVYDGGLAPEPFRTAILREGRFVLSVGALEQRARAWKVLRAAFGLSMDETRTTWAELAAGREGTKVEMEHLKRLLADEGITVEVSRIDSLGGRRT